VSSKLIAANVPAVYLKEVRQEGGLLDREAETELAVRAKAGDARARHDLVKANLKLVLKMAREHTRSAATQSRLPDLVQEGNLGLLLAVDRFDPTRNIKFSTYAAWWIRARILKFVVSNHRMVRVGTTAWQRTLFFNLRKTEESLSAEGKEIVTDEDIGQALGINADDVSEMRLRMSTSEVSLSTPLGPEGRTIEDMVSASEIHQPDVAVERSEHLAKLRAAYALFAKTLRPREAVLWEKRLMADPPVTLERLGRVLGVTRERARQIEEMIYTKLRRFLVSYGLGEDLEGVPTRGREKGEMSRTARMISIGPVTKRASEWAREKNLPVSVFLQRLKHMSPEEALEKPYSPRGSDGGGGTRPVTRTDSVRRICIMCVKDEATHKLRADRVANTHCAGCYALATAQKPASPIVSSGSVPEVSAAFAAETPPRPAEAVSEASEAPPSLASAPTVWRWMDWKPGNRSEVTSLVPGRFLTDFGTSISEEEIAALGPRAEEVRKICRELENVEAQILLLVRRRYDLRRELSDAVGEVA